MKNTDTYTINQTVLQANFSIPYHYEIHYTRDLFGLDNTTIREFFASRTGLESLKPRVLIFIDQGVEDHHPDLPSKITGYFNNLPDAQLVQKIYVLPGSEVIKNDRNAQNDILNAIDHHGIDRHSYVIAIGGGAVLDAVGFAAAISHRGVRHIRVPTTVLSQNDSGIGVKDGINYFGKKNYLGSFTPPEAVWNDLHFLRSLSDRDKRAGLAEAVKVALIKDKSFFIWLEKHGSELNAFNENILQESIMECARLHLHHITTNGDPFEKGSARPLDFGHWVAHKLEDLTHYDIRHGEAVALGITIDTVYSQLMGYIDKNVSKRIICLFEDMGLGHCREYLDQVESDDLLKGLEEFREHLGGQLTITLLDDIGHGFEVHDIDIPTMKNAIKLVRQQLTHDGN